MPRISKITIQIFILLFVESSNKDSCMIRLYKHSIWITKVYQKTIRASKWM